MAQQYYAKSLELSIIFSAKGAKEGHRLFEIEFMDDPFLDPRDDLPEDRSQPEEVTNDLTVAGCVLKVGRNLSKD